MKAVLPFALAGLLLLFFHSARSWGWRRAAIFYLLSLVSMTFKEHYGMGDGEYQVLVGHYQIFGVAPGIPIGWTFAYALSWHLAESIVTRVRGRGDLILPTVSLAVVGVFFVAWAMEVTGIQMGWWEWKIGRHVSAPLRDALRRVGGWGWHGLKFFFVIGMLECRQVRRGVPRVLTALAPIWLLFRFEQWLMPDRGWILTSMALLLPFLAFAEWPKLVRAPKQGIPWAPQIASGIFVAVLLWFHLAALHRPALSLSLLPIAAMALAAAGAERRPGDDAAC